MEDLATKLHVYKDCIEDVYNCLQSRFPDIDANKLIFQRSGSGPGYGTSYNIYGYTDSDIQYEVNYLKEDWDEKAYVTWNIYSEKEEAETKAKELRSRINAEERKIEKLERDVIRSEKYIAKMISELAEIKLQLAKME